MISISQFEEQAGLSRNTVLDSIKELVDKKIVNKQKKQNSFWYSINESYLEILSKTGSSNYEKKGSDSELFKVHYPNYEPVQNVNTLKKDLNKQEINTTTISSISDSEYSKVCEYWNEFFPGTLNVGESDIKKQILDGMSQFSVKELKKAIFNRSEADYYKNKAFHLRENPRSFFGYPQTISNDLQRKPEKAIRVPD